MTEKQKSEIFERQRGRKRFGYHSTKGTKESYNTAMIVGF